MDSIVRDATVRMAITASDARAAELEKRSLLNESNFVSRRIRREPAPSNGDKPPKITTRPNF